MPRVPVLTQRVDTAPLPGTKLSPGAPAAAFQPAAPVDLSGAERFFQEERAKEDQVAVLDADNQLSQLGTDLQTQAFARKGKDALGATKEITQTWKAQSSAIEGTLATDRQKLAFRQRAQARYASLYDAVERHTASEAAAYDQQTTNAALVNRLNDAIANYQDPEKVAGAVAEQRAILTDYGRRTGIAPEALTQQLAAIESRTHAAVIDRMLSNGQDLAAQKYHDQVKDALVGQDAVGVEKALEEGSRRGESQRVADGIIAKGGTLTAWMTAAKDVQDPAVRDLVEGRLKAAWSTQQAAEREQHEGLMLGATNIVERTRDITKVPPSTWTTLSITERNALRDYAQQLQGGGKVETDWTTYYQLKSLASVDDPAVRTRFLQTNLLLYRGALADAEFKELVGLQASLRKGDPEGASQARGIRTNAAIVNDALLSIGVDPSPDPKKKGDVQQATQFRRAVDEQVLEFERRTGKKATTDDVQSITDRLLTQGIVAGSGGFFSSKTPRRVYEAQPGERLVLTIDDVPRSERTQIEAALTRGGYPVTDANILKLYTQRIGRMLRPATGASPE